MMIIKNPNKIRTNLLIETDKEIRKLIKESNFLFGSKKLIDIMNSFEMDIQIKNPTVFAHSLLSSEINYLVETGDEGLKNFTLYNDLKIEDLEFNLKKIVISSRKNIGTQSIITKKSQVSSENLSVKESKAKIKKFVRKIESIASVESKGSLFSLYYEKFFMNEDEKVVMLIQKNFEFLQKLAFKFKKNPVLLKKFQINQKEKFNEELFLILEYKDIKFNLENQDQNKLRMKSFISGKTNNSLNQKKEKIEIRSPKESKDQISKFNNLNNENIELSNELKNTVIENQTAKTQNDAYLVNNDNDYSFAKLGSNFSILTVSSAMSDDR